MSLKSFLVSLKKDWKTLLQIGAFISTTIIGFLTPPEVVEPIMTTLQMKALAVFMAAVSAGIFIVCAKIWRKQKPLYWGIISVLCLFLAIGSLYYFSHSKSRQTCQYFEKEITIGTVYTPQGEKEVKNNPGISCKTLLANFAGNAEDIWTTESINDSRLLIAGTWLLTFILFGICMMSVVQSLKSSGGRRK